MYIRVQSHNDLVTLSTKPQSSYDPRGCCKTRRVYIEGGPLAREGFSTCEPNNVTDRQFVEIKIFHGDPPVAIIKRCSVINTGS
jgi:hypothetical protein